MLHNVLNRARRCVRDIEAAVIRERVPLSDIRLCVEPLEPARALAADGAGWEPVAPGFAWQDAGAALWLRASVAVPAEWAGERVGLVIDIGGGCEPLLYLDGVPAQALDYNHADVLLHDPAAGGETHEIAVECYAPTRGGSFTLRAADLVRIDRAAYALQYDLAVATEALGVLPEASREYQAAQIALDAAMNALDYTGQEGVVTRPLMWHDVERLHRTPELYASIPAAHALLRQGFFEQCPSLGERDPRTLLAGHAHIDLAYLWTVANTRKKVGRTFATALRLMNEFPEYHFTQSQPQLYAWAKEDYPELYAQIQERVAEGRWEPTGGMWVESDCNIPSGESLIRQVLHGNRFFRREFGKTTKVLWLPDVFGYPASLPQIARGCGLDAFMTTKISWSQTNRMPCDTFYWRGLDGAELLTHFVTTTDPGETRYTYNGFVTAPQMRGLWEEYRQMEVNDELLHLYGWGDGGGGPDRRMIEAGRRYASLAGFPRATFGGAEPYFGRLRERLEANAERVPAWVGELYLEFHRGTYTTQARTKKANRRSEVLYHNAELFGTLASVLLGTEFPTAELERGWERILLNQFHDILPGSAIGPAYADAAVDHATITQIGERALNNALEAIAQRIETLQPAVVLFNPTDTLRAADVARVSLPPQFGAATEFADSEDAPLISQRLPDGTFLVLVPEVGALGYQTITVGSAAGAAEESTVQAALIGDANSNATGAVLENDHARVTLNGAGEIVSLVHKLRKEEDANGEEAAVTEREVVPAGCAANALTVYEDRPLKYDAWEIDIHYRAKPYPLREIGTVTRLAVIEEGPVRAGIEITTRFLHSTLTQRIFLYAYGPAVHCEAEVDWQERQMLLRAAFPVAVHATRATYEIQFGSVERPTHRNTSWDEARFEVCAHRWIDLSEGDYGVSLLNDCKYGHDVRDNVLGITLLKGSVSPDADADLGRHEFTYVLLPHSGDWRTDTVDAAYALNYPLLPRFIPANRKGDLPAQYEFATVDDQGIILETIKPAADGGGVVVRLYESFNTRGRATLTLGFPIAAAFAVNLVEENPVPVEHGEYTIDFDFRPFEIKTFLVQPGA